MNLRKDHYRVSRPRGPLSPPCVFTMLLWRLPASAPGVTALNTAYLSSEAYLIVKTFNNGSLGSGIDEERSEMR